MTTEIRFVRSVLEEDLRRVAREDVPLILKKIWLLSTDIKAGYPLGDDLSSFRKLVAGRNTYRIVYRITDDGSSIDVCEIWAVGHRRNAEVYIRAAERVRELGRMEPDLLSLAELLDALGPPASLAVPVVTAPPADPVPAWLYEQLVHTAGVPAEDVLGMTGEQAFARWNDWMSRPRDAG